jgi:hypothetical protein
MCGVLLSLKTILFGVFGTVSVSLFSLSGVWNILLYNMLPVKIFSSLFFLLFSSLSFRFHNVIYFFLLYNLSFFFLFNFFLSSLNLFENGKSNQFFTQSNTNPKLGCFFLLHEKSTKRNGNKISNPIVKLINIKG